MDRADSVILTFHVPKRLCGIDSLTDSLTEKDIVQKNSEQYQKKIGKY